MKCIAVFFAALVAALMIGQASASALTSLPNKLPSQVKSKLPTKPLLGRKDLFLDQIDKLINYYFDQAIDTQNPQAEPTLTELIDIRSEYKRSKALNRLPAIFKKADATAAVYVAVVKAFCVGAQATKCVSEIATKVVATAKSPVLADAYVLAVLVVKGCNTAVIVRSRALGKVATASVDAYLKCTVKPVTDPGFKPNFFCENRLVTFCCRKGRVFKTVCKSLRYNSSEKTLRSITADKSKDCICFE